MTKISAISGSGRYLAAKSSSSDIDWDRFLRRCNELEAKNDEERAAKAGISVRTYYRLRSGETSVTLRKLDAIAKNLGISRNELMGVQS